MINGQDYDSFDDYCDALRGQQWLSPAEYAALLTQSIAYGEESYGEYLTQYRSECAMFGDAGPGQGLQLSNLSRLLSADKAQLARVRRIIDNLNA